MSWLYAFKPQKDRALHSVAHILLTSVIMYAAQRMFIRDEDDALQEKFGGQYEEYRKKVLIKFL